MGLSSKPLTIIIDETLYQANVEYWTTLMNQGFIITREDKREIVDLILAPYAMRFTADMLTQLPAALDLAIKGARALRYAPHGVTIKKGVSNAKASKPRKGKHAAIKTEAVTGGEPPVESLRPLTPGTTQGVGGTTAVPASETTHDERII